MGLFDAFKKPPTGVAPVRSLSDDIAARRQHAEEDDEETRAFNRQLAREVVEREEVLRHLSEALWRCVGVDVEPEGNPALVEGLWFLEEKMPSRDEPFWFLYFCYPCQNCGTLAKAFRLEAISPYDKPAPGVVDEERQEQCLQDIAAFLDRVESGRKRHLCPDCKLEEKPA